MGANTGPYGGTGINYSDLSQPGASSTVSDTVGRWWNELNGTSAVNEYNSLEAEKARMFNSVEAQKNRDWQTFMSNTAYQRSVADMKSAGINPASLGGNGVSSPASTPSASAASGPAAHGSPTSGTGILGLVLSGIGTALSNGIARSSLAVKNGYLDLSKFKANSQNALNAARQVDTEVTSSMKKIRYAKMKESWDAHVAWKKKQERNSSDSYDDATLDRMFAQLGIYPRHG